MGKIIIVDDEAKIRRTYSQFLTDEGFETISCATVAQANELLKAEPVDLVLLDIKMPEVSGDTLYHLVQLFHKQVKVIVTSVYSIDEQKEIVNQAYYYYDKSQKTEILLEKVKSALNVKGGE